MFRMHASFSSGIWRARREEKDRPPLGKPCQLYPGTPPRARLELALLACDVQIALEIRAR